MVHTCVLVLCSSRAACCGAGEMPGIARSEWPVWQEALPVIGEPMGFRERLETVTPEWKLVFAPNLIYGALSRHFTAGS